MEEENVQQKVQKKNFKQRFLNKKVLLITFIVVIVLGVGGTAGLVKASDNPTFCTLCHNMQPYYASWHDNDSNLLANKHAQAGVKCHDCHESTITVQASEGLKYVTENYQNPLEKRDFATKEFCVRCHDLEQVKAKTNFEESNPHDNHNGELECYTCHSTHQPSQLLCKQCHTFSWMENLPAYWEK